MSPDPELWSLTPRGTRPATKERSGESMDRNSLRPLYSTLTGEERFRLAVQTLVAGDHAEALYMLKSRPNVVGTIHDPAFTGPALASYRLASAFAQAAGPYLGWLNLVAVLEDLLTGEQGRDRLPVGASVSVAMVLDLAASAAARDLRGLVDAFRAVCRDRAGLAPEILVRFWVPQVAAALEAAEVWIDGLEADPAIVESCRAGLDVAWTLQTGEE